LLGRDHNENFDADYYKDFEFEGHLRDSMVFDMNVPFQPNRFYYFKVDMYTWNS
jgi:hypothetical protein